MPFVIASIREAVFVVSPTAVYSIRRSDPTLPDITCPLFSPIPIRKPSPSPSERIQSLNAGSFSQSISRAAARARSA